VAHSPFYSNVTFVIFSVYFVFFFFSNGIFLSELFNSYFHPKIKEGKKFIREEGVFLSGNYFIANAKDGNEFKKDKSFTGLAFNCTDKFYNTHLFNKFFNSIKSSNFMVNIFSFFYKNALTSVFLDNETKNRFRSESTNSFYRAFITFLKNKEVGSAIVSETKSEKSFVNYLFVKEKKNKLISLKTSDILAKNDRTLTLSFLKHLVIVDLFLKKFIIGVYSNVLKQIYAFTLDLVTSTFCPSDLKKSLRYFPFFFTGFSALLFLNTIGLIPYSSTFTSYMSVTLFLTMTVLVAAYFLVFSRHGIKFFGLFVPQGCPFGLIFIIIPIEFVSYVFRMVSLSARLFANMMAGHALVAVLAGFSWVMFNTYELLPMMLSSFPLFVVFLLFFLETGVAVVQAVVFTILSCMYIDEAVNLSH